MEMDRQEEEAAVERATGLAAEEAEEDEDDEGVGMLRSNEELQMQRRLGRLIGRFYRHKKTDAMPKSTVLKLRNKDPKLEKLTDELVEEVIGNLVKQNKVRVSDGILIKV